MNSLKLTNSLTKKKEVFKPNNIKKQILIANGFIYPSSVLINRNSLKQVKFDTRFQKGIDSDFFRTLILINNFKIYFRKCYFWIR